MNYFELFGLPTRFSLDTQLLAERHRELQRTFHPDKYANASPVERRLAVQRAAEINQAFHTLSDPVERARYLLQLQGVETEQAAAVSQAFLMEQMEMREALAEIREQPDPVAALEALIAAISRRIDSVLLKLVERFEEKSEASLHAARELVAELMFLKKIEREANELFDELLED